MAQRRKAFEKQEVVRKPLLIIGGIAIGAALLGFVLMNFIGGGGGGEPEPETTAPAAGQRAPVSTPSPTPVIERPGLRPGGRDPFAPIVGAPAGITEPTPAPTTEVLAAQETAPAPVYIRVINTYAGSADVKIANTIHEGAQPGQRLTNGFFIRSVSEGCVDFGDANDGTFNVCEGQRTQRTP